LQEQRDQFALAMRVRLGKDGFQVIARRLPGNLQFAGGDIGYREARRAPRSMRVSVSGAASDANILCRPFLVNEAPLTLARPWFFHGRA